MLGSWSRKKVTDAEDGASEARRLLDVSQRALLDEMDAPEPGPGAEDDRRERDLELSRLAARCEVLRNDYHEKRDHVSHLYQVDTAKRSNRIAALVGLLILIQALVQVTSYLAPREATTPSVLSTSESGKGGR